MQNSIIQENKATIFNFSINDFAIGISLLVVLIYLLLPGIVDESFGATYFAVILLLGGIVHGASDYFMYQALSSRDVTLNRKIIFYLSYLFTVLGFAFIWFITPTIALLIFVGISIYHFGQSNWYQHQLPKGIFSKTVYLTWGAFVVLTPLLLHIQETNRIVGEIIPFEILISKSGINIIISTLFGLNIVLLFFSLWKRYLNRVAFNRELINLIVLLTLFGFTPLLVGFAIYFAVWHSTYATYEQVQLLKRRMHRFSFNRYLRSLMTLSLLAFLGMGLAYYIITTIFRIPFGWGMFFLLVSLITLPHSYFIDKFYES